VEGLVSHDLVGFNQWDTSKDNTGKCLNGVGDLATNPNYAVSDYIRTVPNTVYYLKNVAPVIDAISYAEYDIDKVCVNPYGGVTGEHDANASGTITTGANTAYIRVVRRSTATDCCVNLHGERDGTYEPYTKHSYPLDSTLTLRGVPKLSNGEVYYDGDTYESDGTVTRKYGVVDLGTLTWTLSGQIFKAVLPNGYTSSANTVDCVCPLYIAAASVANGNMWMNQGNINIVNSAYSTADAFKTAMSGVYLVYELATPTEETADPYTNPQSVDPYGTEEYVTSGLVAVGHETSYLGKFESVGFGLGNPSAPSEDEPTEEAEEVTEELTEEPTEEPTEEAND
jgi:hypothetical protein